MADADAHPTNPACTRDHSQLHDSHHEIENPTQSLTEIQVAYKKPSQVRWLHALKLAKGPDQWDNVGIPLRSIEPRRYSTTPQQVRSLRRTRRRRGSRHSQQSLPALSAPDLASAVVDTALGEDCRTSCHSQQGWRVDSKLEGWIWLSFRCNTDQRNQG